MQDVPALWKSARLKMLHKKGDSLDLITIDQSVSYHIQKNIESILHKKNSKYLEQRLSLANSIERSEKFCKNSKAKVGFVDFAKAFDTFDLTMTCVRLKK